MAAPPPFGSGCPVPHTRRDVVWLALGAGLGVAAGRLLYSRGKRWASSQKADARCFTVALTGGPCGGKSSSLDTFSTALKTKGYDVYTVPEVPTILIKGGCEYPGHDGGDRLMAFEMGLIRLQMQIEESFLRIAASTGRPSVVVMDRGLMDIPAYLPAEQWKEVLAANELTEAELAARYDLVLHLKTAADGAEKFYTTDNNDARTETPAEARALDEKMIANWARAHSNVVVVDNSGTFSDKCARASAAVCENVAAKLP
jgi:predicted ATPase